MSKPDFRIAILDAVPESFSHVDAGYSDGQKFIDLLTNDPILNTDMPVRFIGQRYAIAEGEWPADLSAYDGVLISGSPASVNDEEPWMMRLADEIRGCNAREQKLIGVCFGHQKIARSLGGEVKHNEHGWLIENVSLCVDQPQPWMTPVQPRTNVLHFNQERVHTLPSGALSYLSTDQYPNFGFVIGNHIMTIQGHPEQPLASMKKFLHEVASYGDSPEAMINDHQPKLEQNSPHDELWARWFLQFYLN